MVTIISISISIGWIGADAIWWSIPIGWIVGGILASLRYRSGKWDGSGITKKA